MCDYSYNGEGAILVQERYSGRSDFVSFFPCVLRQEVKKGSGMKMWKSLFLDGLMKEGIAHAVYYCDRISRVEWGRGYPQARSLCLGLGMFGMLSIIFRQIGTMRLITQLT